MKKGLLMFALVMIAVFLGTLVGELTSGIEGVGWLGKTYEFGLSTFDLDLHLIVLTFGLHIKFCIAEILFLLIALLSYSSLAKLIFGGAPAGK